jgi:hypothetical protein
MSTNYDLDFSGSFPVNVQDGMAQAYENANDRWKRYVDGCIQAVAREHAFFTIDEVLAKLEALPTPPSTHNLSALGPRMLEVSKELKYMRATDELKRSARPEKHRRFLRVWRSNLL